MTTTRTHDHPTVAVPAPRAADVDGEALPAVRLSEFTIERAGLDDVVFRDDPDAAAHEFRRTSRDEGAVMVRLGIDGLWTIVAMDRGQTAQLALVEQGIAALSEVRDQLRRMAPTAAGHGRCLAQGDWGRCLSLDGHEGDDHRFPTEADWRAQSNVPAASPCAEEAGR